jgi:hypothetical protein
MLWKEPVETDRDDLAVELFDSGTGIGQVLAVLYVLITSDEPQSIVVDEPNSFLHPGASRELLNILNEFPQHQYIIATHSADVITQAKPTQILAVRQETGRSRVEPIGKENVEAIQASLASIGARLSDVYGADRVLWVEGITEEKAYPLVLAQFGIDATGLFIVAVRNTSDFSSRRLPIELVIDIYRRLSGGKFLIPAAAGFIFDAESRTPEQQKDASRQSGGVLRFLARRMFENYLLEPQAIAAALAARGVEVTVARVLDWIHQHGTERKYFVSMSSPQAPLSPQWRRDVDAAELLHDMYLDVSGATVEYSKTIDSFELTRWILTNDPQQLRELAELLREVVAARD